MNRFDLIFQFRLHWKTKNLALHYDPKNYSKIPLPTAQDQGRKSHQEHNENIKLKHTVGRAIHQMKNLC